MKKLVLKQVVEKIPAKYGTFWRYTEKRSQMNETTLI